MAIPGLMDLLSGQGQQQTAPQQQPAQGPRPPQMPTQGARQALLSQAQQQPSGSNLLDYLRENEGQFQKAGQMPSPCGSFIRAAILP